METVLEKTLEGLTTLERSSESGKSHEGLLGGWGGKCHNSTGRNSRACAYFEAHFRGKGRMDLNGAENTFRAGLGRRAGGLSRL